MSDQAGRALRVSAKVLQILSLLNRLAGAGIVIMLIASIVAPEWMMRALKVDDSALRVGMYALMVGGIVSVAVWHSILRRLSQIVGTVEVGTPFVAENAVRLKAIAWAMLGLEVLRLMIIGISRTISTASAPIDIAWDFPVTGWLAILLLFVLARVFDEGTRMREELDGTV